MGVLAWIKDHSQQTMVAIVIVVIATLAYVDRSALSSPSVTTEKAYFTVDDGATQFVDSSNKLAPFDHDGKPAYRITMYSTDGGKTKLAGYMERYTPQGKARMETLQQDIKSAAPHAPLPPDLSGTEVKLPGPGHPWVNRASGQEALKIINAQMPSNPDASYEVVVP